MITTVLLLLLAATVTTIATTGNVDNTNITTTAATANAPCVPTYLSTIPLPPKALSYITIATDASKIFAKLPPKRHHNITHEAAYVRTIFNQHTRIFAIAIVSPDHPNLLAYRKRDRLLIHRNRTLETEPFWHTVDYSRNRTGNEWAPPFKDCWLNRGTWYQAYLSTESNRKISVAVFMPVVLNQCEPLLAEIFGGRHKCDETTTECIPKLEYGMRRGGYKCNCRARFYFPERNTSWRGFSGTDVESGLLTARCLACPELCDHCDSDGQCMAHPNIFFRSIILGVQVVTMGVTVIIAVITYMQRKSKIIASGMWPILEVILVGILILYCTILVRFFEPSVARCLAEPWMREVGFIVCYGAIVLKLYRHLIDFRTRKAHRWVVKANDLLKYLCVMILAVLAYMAAFTAISLNFISENYTILTMNQNRDGLHFITCKPLWWDYVTQVGEIIILLFGLHLSYATRNAATQFQERNFLCAAISVEFAISGIFYIVRPIYLPVLHPDQEYLAYFARSQLTTSTVVLLIFLPKLWYQHKHARSLAQEFSCRLPVDAFRPDVACNTHGALVSNYSEIDIGEISLAEMTPEDIKSELKRCYTQMEIMRIKTLRQNNPHISKRRGGRKVAHRRFSLQALHGKHKSHKHPNSEVEGTEGEMSRTPEDSVCSAEGPSAIYNDLASTYSELIGTPNAAAICKPQSSYST